MAEMNKFQENLDKLDEKLKKSLGQRLKQWAISLKNEIKERTKHGLGVSSSGEKEKVLKPLKDSTIKTRKNLKTKGQLSSDTQPEFSNQIQSGEMVNNMQVSVNTNKLEAEITPPNTRKDIAKYQAEKGRAIFNLSDTQLEDLKKDIEEEVVKNIKDMFK